MSKEERIKEAAEVAKVPYIQEADEYQAFAIRTMSADYAAIEKRITAITQPITKSQLGRIPRVTDLLHAALGIETEAGEFADPLKKYIFYGKPIDSENMREELGDLLWYIAIAADALETSLSELMTDNIRKLAKRYPEQVFRDQHALERADKKGFHDEDGAGIK